MLLGVLCAPAKLFRIGRPKKDPNAPIDDDDAAKATTVTIALDDSASNSGAWASGLRPLLDGPERWRCWVGPTTEDVLVVSSPDRLGPVTNCGQVSGRDEGCGSLVVANQMRVGRLIQQMFGLGDL